MKGGINFELKADNIIHAPVDTPKRASGKAGIRNPESGIRNPESGIGTGIGTGTGTGTGIGTGMGRETYIKAGTTFTLI